MANFQTHIRHDGGTHNVEVEVDGDKAVIAFGASFTLRLDEQNVDKLRWILHDASIAIACNKSESLAQEASV